MNAPINEVEMIITVYKYIKNGIWASGTDSCEL